MHFLKITTLLLLLVSLAARAQQDTLNINLQQADSIYLINNFYLVAASMNIEASRAGVIQARLYPNPVFTAEVNAYDPENNKVLHIGGSGQKLLQVEQLILLGGKKKSEIEMAKTNAKIAELEFEQLARQLKFRLHKDLFTIGQKQLLLERYNSQLALLNTLLTAYQVQADKGNVPLKDVVRLKGAYMKLNNDRAELLKDFFEAQGSLQALLQTSSIVHFIFSEEEIENYIKLKSLQEIQEAALQHQPEVLIMKHNKLLAEQNFHYQKRLGIPDINLFSSYDQRSGAFNNQVNAGVSVPLPLWNKNQGNIRSSQFKIKEAEYNVMALQHEIAADVQNAFLVYTETIAEYRKAYTLYNEDFEITVRGMTDNFQKGNVSIIEFIDFFEAYNDVLTELSRIKTQLVISGEQLNLLTGKDIF
ncbi:TolC family protein [Terrimonas sp.]|uniref:TolC family protein n=1 Tax=Terrimonas sp. TaxID=1914338 RepID=UPI000D517ABB|nr:TolC family protein [Terrimonas sp.]PVD53920.1 TolC family protein [Terrimonas sp.]